MANIKVSELDAAQAIADEDLLLVSQDVGGGELESRKLTLGDLSDRWVDVSGDTMFGPLVFQYTYFDPELGFLTSDIDISWTEVSGARGQLTISPDTSESIVSIHGGSAYLSSTGQLITGRFRFCHPVSTGNPTLLLSGDQGHVTSIVRYTSATPVAAQIRNNTGSLTDFHQGARIDIVQEGAGQVTLSGENGNVTLLYPSDKIPATRTQYSMITASLIVGGQEEETSETWVISGDMADAP